MVVNGILTFPGDARNWAGRATTWMLSRGIAAQEFPHFVGPLGRTLRQADLASKLAKRVHHFAVAGFEVSFIAHSNGANVVLGALKLLGYPRIGKLELLSPACPADCDDSCINKVNAESITVHVGGKDWALMLAGLPTGKWLGFGTLGRDGPQDANVPIVTRRVDAYGHSDWFTDEHFEETMLAVVV